MFDIDISVCMQCQICVEVCPFDAIKMDNDYEKSQYGRFNELVEHLPDLLKSNEYYHKIKSTEATAIDTKLKEAAEKKAKKAAPAKPAAPAQKPVAAGTAATTTTPTTAKIQIPADAPFSPEQREWLGKFLATVSTGTAPVPAKTATAAALATEVAETAVPTADAPWHDPSLGMPQRMDLAKTKPFADKLMAAMAQTDCHACGYDCRGYADAIASGAESDLSLCLPGEAETQQMLEKLTKEAGKA